MKITVSLPPHTLMLGDCLERMKEIPDGSVDMVMCDLPYGTTACSWDSVIPFNPLWTHYRRIIKPNGAVVLTASQPFTSALVMSNPKWFRYEWIWRKQKPTGFLDARRKPLKAHESVLVFCQRAAPYFPQGLVAVNVKSSRKNKAANGVYSSVSACDYVQREGNFPRSIISFQTDTNNPHPTAKPVSLLEYMIQTYTDEGETVLDNCFGSASTGIACINTGRRFIGVEQDPHYFDVGRRRMEEAMRQAAQPAPQGGLFDSQAAE